MLATRESYLYYQNYFYYIKMGFNISQKTYKFISICIAL